MIVFRIHHEPLCNAQPKVLAAVLDDDSNVFRMISTLDDTAKAASRNGTLNNTEEIYSKLFHTPRMLHCTNHGHPYIATVLHNLRLAVQNRGFLDDAEQRFHKTPI